MATKKKVQLPKHMALRGQTYWYMRTYRGVPDRFSLETTSLKVAKVKLEQYELSHCRTGLGLPEEKVGLTFSQAWTAYCLYAGKRTSEGGMKQKHLNWLRFSTWMEESIGVATLDAVTPMDILAWQDALTKSSPKGKTLKAVSINDYVHRSAGAVWSRLVKLKAIKENPFRDVEMLPEPEVDVKSLPWDTVKRVLAVAEKVGRDIHLVFTLGALAGMRRGEIYRAQWSDVEWDAGRLWVRGEKTVGSSADVPLHQDLRAALEPYRGDDGDYIVKPEDLEAYNDWGYRWDHEDAKQAVLDLSDVPHCTTHMLRHSVAQRLVNTGYSELELARFLRHAPGSYATRAYFKTRLIPITINGSL